MVGLDHRERGNLVRIDGPVLFLSAHDFRSPCLKAGLKDGGGESGTTLCMQIVVGVATYYILIVNLILDEWPGRCQCSAGGDTLESVWTGGMTAGFAYKIQAKGIFPYPFAVSKDSF